MVEFTDVCTDCKRAAAVRNARCVAHLSDPEFDDHCARVARAGIVDARRATISAGRLNRLLEAAQEGSKGEVTALLLDEATVKGEFAADPLKLGCYASLAGATFEGGVELAVEARCPVTFKAAIFRGPVAIGGQFAHSVDFDRAEFGDSLSLYNVFVAGVGFFVNARFGGRLELGQAQFLTALRISDTQLDHELVLTGARVGWEPKQAKTVEPLMNSASWWAPLADSGETDFAARLADDQAALLKKDLAAGAHLLDLVVRAPARFDYMQVRGEKLTLKRLRFERGTDFDEAVLAAERSQLEDCRFTQDVRVAIGGREADLIYCRFEEGADLDVSPASLSIERCRFGSPSVVATDWSETEEPPRLLSLRGTDCERLRLRELDLAPCRFHGAVNLDHLGIAGAVRLARPERGSRRDVIADELIWRAREEGWKSPELRKGEDRAARRVPPNDTLEPADVAALYRGLRKGSEDAKDEPGAADFYYGEMEMRRKSPGGAQRAILTAYWVLSGYALRPWRAFVALFLAVIAFSALFGTAGFAERPAVLKPIDVTARGNARYQLREPHEGNPVEQGLDAFAYTAGTATAVIGTSERPLTRSGRIMRIVLRIVGPILIALLVLSIRGRVKR